MELEKIADRFDSVAKNYDEQRRFFIPCFDDFYGTSTGFLSQIIENPKSLLDLGAGTGLLTKYLFEKYPNASFTLVDIAEQMIEVARKRFDDQNNFKFLISNYSECLPEGEFDLIASALSIHHITDQQKLNLYSMIYQKLPQDGCFINLDQFNATSELMNRHYVKWWHNFIDGHIKDEKERELYLKRRELDKEDTIEATIQKLRTIGFRHVDCIYSFMKFGVIVAIK
jgi:tRNA (cmo5U34)-methyltransferase